MVQAFIRAIGIAALTQIELSFPKYKRYCEARGVSVDCLLCEVMAVLHKKVLNSLLSCSMSAVALGLGTSANAVTLSSGTTVLSDTPEFLNLQFPDGFSLLQGGCDPSGLPIVCTLLDGPVVPVYLGQNWNVLGNRVSAPFFRGQIDRIFVEQVTPTTTRPQAQFSAGLDRDFFFPFPGEQVSYLADAPAGTYSSVTCAFGSPNCVSYEFGAQFQRSFCDGPCDPPDGPVPFIRPSTFNLKGFFNASNPSQVPEGETGMGALAALGTLLIARSCRNALKNAPKTFL